MCVCVGLNDLMQFTCLGKGAWPRHRRWLQRNNRRWIPLDKSEHKWAYVLTYAHNEQVNNAAAATYSEELKTERQPVQIEREKVKERESERERNWESAHTDTHTQAHAQAISVRLCWNSLRKIGSQASEATSNIRKKRVQGFAQKTGTAPRYTPTHTHSRSCIQIYLHTHTHARIELGLWFSLS